MNHALESEVYQAGVDRDIAAGERDQALAALSEIRAIVLTPSKKTSFAPTGKGASDHYASDFDKIRKICNTVLNTA